MIAYMKPILLDMPIYEVNIIVLGVNAHLNNIALFCLCL